MLLNKVKVSSVEAYDNVSVLMLKLARLSIAMVSLLVKHPIFSNEHTGGNYKEGGKEVSLSISLINTYLYTCISSLYIVFGKRTIWEMVLQ